MKQSTDKLNQAIERMTTGFKINHASDNAANYSISTNMTTKINSYMVAEDNVAMGLDLISTAEGTLNQIQDKLERLRALQEQASNGTYGEQSLQAINAEANALVDEINRLYSTAEYNGLKFFGSEEATPAVASFAMMRAVTVDEAKRVSNVSSFTSGETYYITDSADLVALQDLVNEEYADTSGVIFELANNIDMAGIDFDGIGVDVLDYFRGEFNGNGFTIYNLTNNSTNSNGAGLFNVAAGTIKNLNLKNCNISGSNSVGGLIGRAFGNITIENCAVEGQVKTTGLQAGGLIGFIGQGYTDFSVKIDSCTSEVVVTGGTESSGLVGAISSHEGSVDAIIKNCSVKKYSDVASVFCCADNSTGITLNLNLENCTYNSLFDTNSIEYIISRSAIVNLNNVNPIDIVVDIPTPDPDTGGAGVGGNTGGGVNQPEYAPDTILLQIGVSSDRGSQVGVSTKFSLTGVDDLRMIGLDLTTDYLSLIDDMLELVAEKQTHFGATSNRLESVLEEITIKRDNLVSSRSTIRDADIAEVSSHYIQQQILQQASATLMATANQSPAIALGLI